MFSDSCSSQITLIGNLECWKSDLREIYILTIMSKKVTSSLQDKQCINYFKFSVVIRIKLLLTVVPFLQFKRSRKILWVQQHKIYSDSKFFWKPYFKILNEKKYKSNTWTLSLLNLNFCKRFLHCILPRLNWTFS